MDTDSDGGPTDDLGVGRTPVGPPEAGLRAHRTAVVPPKAAGVLTEDEALELLAYLVTSARTQVDEAAEYGPLRLLTAARRLGAAIADRSSGATAAFVTGPLTALPELAVPKADREAYVGRLDQVCRELAALLVDRFAS